MGILLTILVLSLVVLVHEYGHYVAMRRNGVTVVEFTIGFGPTIWSHKLKSGTTFKLKPILLGGYTMPVTVDAEGKMRPDSVEAQSAWARFKIYMAGMFFNATAAFLVMAVINYSTGTVLAITVPYIKPLYAPHFLVPLIGAFVASYGLWLATPVMLVKLIAGGLASFLGSVSGPVGIVSGGSTLIGSSSTAAAMAMNIAYFFVMLNVALAGFNMLPFYPLDGGRVFDLLIAAVGGKHASKLQKAYRVAGTVLILGIFIMAILGDFISLARGHH